MLLNAAKFQGCRFTVSELLREKQQRGETQACNFIKIETLAQVLSCEFCEVSNNILFTEHVWMLNFTCIQRTRLDTYKIILNFPWEPEDYWFDCFLHVPN